MIFKTFFYFIWWEGGRGGEMGWGQLTGGRDFEEVKENGSDRTMVVKTLLVI